MFTGLIQAMGKILQNRPIKEGKEVIVHCPQLIPEIQVDDSVAINGVCQTVTSLTSTSFKVQCVTTSINKTTLGKLSQGEEVNLELALRVGDRLGGHLVQGHVNGIGKIQQIEQKGDARILWVKLPMELLPYTVKEGSITLDGISLTISDKKDQELSVSIIPHTFMKTNLKNKKIGDFLNIEVDMMAKYVESFLAPHFRERDSSSFQKALSVFERP